MAFHFQQRKKSRFPEAPSVRFPSWFPHPLPSTRLRDSGQAYLGAVTTCYTLNNEDYKWLHNTVPWLTSTEAVGSWIPAVARPSTGPGVALPRTRAPRRPSATKRRSEDGAPLTARACAGDPGLAPPGRGVDQNRAHRGLDSGASWCLPATGCAGAAARGRCAPAAGARVPRSRAQCAGRESDQGPRGSAPIRSLQNRNTDPGVPSTPRHSLMCSNAEKGGRQPRRSGYHPASQTCPIGLTPSGAHRTLRRNPGPRPRTTLLHFKGTALLTKGQSTAWSRCTTGIPGPNSM